MKSTSLAIKDTDIKTTIKYNNMPIKWLKIKNTDNTTCRKNMDLSYISGMNVKWFTHFGKQVSSFFIR